MSSTNKTTNYNLSQFVGTDKPAWLGDYNQDMSRIDTGIHNAAEAATAAQGTATAAANGLGDITDLETDVKTDAVAAINSTNTKAETAQNTANTAAGTAETAAQNISQLKDYLSLGRETSITFTTNAGTVSTTYASVKSVRNNTNSLGKVYGQQVVSNVAGTGDLVLTSSDTGFRPLQDIVINGVAYIQYHHISGGTDRNKELYPVSITLQTNGTMRIVAPRQSDANVVAVMFWACVIFIEDFGDVIEPVNPGA